MYIFDGYNFIHKIPELKTAMSDGPGAGRRALASYLVALAPRLGVKLSQLTVVYDGNTKYDDLGGERTRLNTVFSRGGKNADRCIVELVSESDDAHAVTVVSDDNMVANNVRVYGAKVLRAKEFLALLAKRSRGRPGRRDDAGEERKVIRDAEAITRSLAREWEIE